VPTPTLQWMGTRAFTPLETVHVCGYMWNAAQKSSAENVKRCVILPEIFVVDGASC
jgi:hypothetical protein